MVRIPRVEIYHDETECVHDYISVLGATNERKWTHTPIRARWFARVRTHATGLIRRKKRSKVGINKSLCDFQIKLVKLRVNMTFCLFILSNGI